MADAFSPSSTPTALRRASLADSGYVALCLLGYAMLGGLALLVVTRVQHDAQAPFVMLAYGCAALLAHVFVRPYLPTEMGPTWYRAQALALTLGVFVTWALERM